MFIKLRNGNVYNFMGIALVEPFDPLASAPKVKLLDQEYKNRNWKQWRPRSEAETQALRAEFDRASQAHKASGARTPPPRLPFETKRSPEEWKKLEKEFDARRARHNDKAQQNYDTYMRQYGNFRGLMHFFGGEQFGRPVHILESQDEFYATARAQLLAFGLNADMLRAAQEQKIDRLAGARTNAQQLNLDMG